jgi:hypothetical protein
LEIDYFSVLRISPAHQTTEPEPDLMGDHPWMNPAFSSVGFHSSAIRDSVFGSIVLERSRWLHSPYEFELAPFTVLYWKENLRHVLENERHTRILSLI